MAPRHPWGDYAEDVILFNPLPPWGAGPRPVQVGWKPAAMRENTEATLCSACLKANSEKKSDVPKDSTDEHDAHVSDVLS